MSMHWRWSASRGPAPMCASTMHQVSTYISSISNTPELESKCLLLCLCRLFALLLSLNNACCDYAFCELVAMPLLRRQGVCRLGMLLTES